MSEDYKEKMTAILTILLCLYHDVRSGWGLIQLRAFYDWCLEMTSILSEHDMLNTIPTNRLILVNEIIIDTEIYGLDIEMSSRLPSLRNTIGGMNGFWKAV